MIRPMGASKPASTGLASMRSDSLKVLGLTLSRSHIVAGEIVHSHGIAEIKGSIGLAKGAHADVVIVSFPEGEGNYKQEALRKLVPGDNVRYTGNNRRIPNHEFGIVRGVLPTLLVKVEYPAFAPQKGEEVKYVGTEPGIPTTEIGKVEEVTLDGLTIWFPSCKWANVPSVDLRFEFNIPFVCLKYIDVKTVLTTVQRRASRAGTNRSNRPGTSAQWSNRPGTSSSQRSKPSRIG